jgi:hypothetical protein
MRIDEQGHWLPPARLLALPDIEIDAEPTDLAPAPATTRRPAPPPADADIARGPDGRAAG